MPAKIPASSFPLQLSLNEHYKALWDYWHCWRFASPVILYIARQWIEWKYNQILSLSFKSFTYASIRNFSLATYFCRLQCPTMSLPNPQVSGLCSFWLPPQAHFPKVHTAPDLPFHTQRLSSVFLWKNHSLCRAKPCSRTHSWQRGFAFSAFFPPLPGPHLCTVVSINTEIKN